jgi:hypothetical protein
MAVATVVRRRQSVWAGRLKSVAATGFDSLVGAFGATCAEKLGGPGDREAAIRAPLEALVAGVGKLIGVPAVLHDEVRDPERQVRPDYGVSVNKAIMGYIEVKAPGRGIDPAGFTGHDKVQWERQRDLPNLVYTNGTMWRFYRDGEPVGSEVVLTDQALATVGGQLRSNPDLEGLLTGFLRWKAAPITSVSALVRAVAPLTRLLRGEVVDQLRQEARRQRGGAKAEDLPFSGLAADWRQLLFPQADDATFADGYAQAVTFALLLARTEGITLAGRGLHDIGQDLGAEHSLMGRALQLLTDDVAADFKVVLDLLVTVVGAVQWNRIRTGKRDVYLYLYEEFLGAYDPVKRQASGTYYTPRELVVDMVRLVDEVLTNRLGITDGFRASQVTVVDPAMGTGTYLHTIIDRAQTEVAAIDGPGAVAGAITELASRLVGFEIQMGPYAVAELRITELLTSLGAKLPKDGLRLFVTDTLDDPYAAEAQLGSGLQTIAKARREANKVKASQPITVVIGNPPYRELASGGGGWVEYGADGPGAKHARGILEDFLVGVPGKLSAKLKNLYVYFYRWATWKVWESTPSDEAGVVCFITTSGYLTGPAFTSMRQYLRRESSAGWIIDLTPEGQTPDVPTRIFPGVRQPLAIGLFVRQADNDPGKPAELRYTQLSGTQAEKFSGLAQLSLDGPQWRKIRTDWTSPFTAAPDSAWDTWPALSDLLPWYSPGLFPTRTWIYSPSPNTLQERWARLVAEQGVQQKNALMKAGRDADATRSFPPLYGTDVVVGTEKRLEWEDRTTTQTVQVGFRAFDRQHVIADRRLFDMPRPTLWQARQPGQVFAVEMSQRKITSGPAVVFSHLIPDFHYFKGSEGGRTLPWLHPNGSPNLPDGLVAALSTALGVPVEPEDVLAYVAAIAGHPGFTALLATELETPGVRVPVTTDPGLWLEAVELGKEVLWIHTYGETFAGPGRPQGSVRYLAGDARQIQALTSVQDLPDGHTYDEENQELVVGTGRFGPVIAQVAAYSVGGRNVVKSWVDYRKAEPAGRRSTALDEINPDRWEHAWTGELIDLLTVLDRLTRMEPAQLRLLDQVVGGAVLSRDALTTAGVSWGTNSRPWGDTLL